MTIRVISEGIRTLESTDAYWAPANTISSLVVGRSSVVPSVDMCSGIRLANRYQVTAAMAAMISGVVSPLETPVPA